jgi:hypothetical protein
LLVYTEKTHLARLLLGLRKSRFAPILVWQQQRRGVHFEHQTASLAQQGKHMKPESRPDKEPPVEQQPALSSEDDRRVRARRRFLRMGAGGSAALVVTVVHKRAFAGIKKNVVASACTSLQGVPDLKHVNQKKALETSAMGTPKGLICRPRPPAHDPNKVGSCMPSKASKYFQLGIGGNTKVQIVEEGELKHGCGSILQSAMPPNNTISASYNYRLYEKGYCPIVYDGSGGLKYDLTAKFYRSATDTVGELCKGP